MYLGVYVCMLDTILYSDIIIQLPSTSYWSDLFIFVSYHGKTQKPDFFNQCKTRETSS